MVERQADTATIIRNFLTERFNPLYPRIDWRGTTTGEVESEFQLYTFIVASLAAITHSSYEILGRLVSIAFSILTLLAFYSLLLRIASQQTAIIGTVILAWFPAYAYFSRVIMPESLLLFLAVATMLFYIKWSQDHSRVALFIWICLLTASILVKPYMAHLALPIAMMAFTSRDRRTLTDPWLYVGVLFVLIIPVAYYYHAHSLFQSTGLTFGVFDPGAGKWFNPDLYSLTFFQKILFTRLLFQHANWALLAAAVGLAITWRERKSSLFRWWLLAVIFYFFIVNQGNYLHIHYQFPAIFVIAYFAAEGFSAYINSNERFHRILAVSFLALFLITSFLVGTLLFITERLPSENILTQIPGPLKRFALINPELISTDEIRTISTAINHHSPTDSLLVISGKTAPIFFYSTTRKGWKGSIEELTDSLLITRKNQRASHVIINTRTADASTIWNSVQPRLSTLTRVFDTLGVAIYEIR